jgi:hypothetical protein
MSSDSSLPHVHLTLIESARTASIGHRLAVGGSVTGQVLLFCAVVVGVSAWQARVQASDVRDERPTFLAPLLRKLPPPVEERLSYVGLGGALRPTGDVARTSESDSPRLLVTDVPADSGGDGQEAAQQQQAEPQRAYFDVEVDSTVVRDSTSEGPAYPAELLSKNINGYALASFVVDTNGRADPTTFVALESTHPAFAEAVRVALPRMKFRPAIMAGVRVRQLVQQQFSFRVVNPAVS